MHFSDLCFSYFHNCNFERSSLAVTKIGSAEFINCNFFKADLSYCSAEETNFTG
ncbi:pentapeptide repeat-containing protein, partial [Vibrio parahaemolyticus]|uniref:pentapeptide repeat-containing protein n=1 Tax=Vibrio parahaemolyticus TaxID=670 RepID=UPI00358E23A1